MRKIIFALVSATALLVGCGNPHKGEHCVRSHDYTYTVNGVCLVWTGTGSTTSPRVCIMYQQIPMTGTSCDEWVKDTPAPSNKEGGY